MFLYVLQTRREGGVIIAWFLSFNKDIQYKNPFPIVTER